MLKFFSIIIFLIITFNANANNNEKIIENLKNIDSIDFNFEQNTNGKKEKGKCTIEYPKKIFCQYSKINNKILVSNGTSLVIKTKTSYYRYPLDKTPLNLILDKNYLISKIFNLTGRTIDNNLITYKILDNDNELSVFFNKKTYDLVGWQNIDLYQNFNITFISVIKKNRVPPKDLFKIPIQN